MPDNTIFKDRTDADAWTSAVTMQKWGGLASFLMAVAFIVAPLIYFLGDLRDAIGPLAYALADFLYGPVWAASLVTAVFALRERIGERAPRRMTLALLAALVAAGAMVGVACIRSANRHYHLIHPELHLDMSTPVLVVWTTLVAGVIATGWHFLGWAWVLVGSAGWTSRRLPRALSMLYLVECSPTPAASPKTGPTASSPPHSPTRPTRAETADTSSTSPSGISDLTGTGTNGSFGPYFNTR